MLLLQAIRAELPKPYLLTTALPTGTYCLKHLDLIALSSVLDFINLMAYDFYGPWTPQSGHHAALYGDRSGAAGVQYLLRHGFPAAQTVLGIPAYGRVFHGVSNVGQPCAPCDESEATVEYGDFMQNLDATIIQTDRTLCAAWAQDAASFTSFDNPTTVAVKAEYVRSLGLAGVFFWTGTSDARGQHSLVAAAWRVLNHPHY